MAGMEVSGAGIILAGISLGFARASAPIKADEPARLFRRVFASTLSTFSSLLGNGDRTDAAIRVALGTLRCFGRLS